MGGTVGVLSAGLCDTKALLVLTDSRCLFDSGRRADRLLLAFKAYREFCKSQGKLPGCFCSVASGCSSICDGSARQHSRLRHQGGDIRADIPSEGLAKARAISRDLAAQPQRKCPGLCWHWRIKPSEPQHPNIISLPQEAAHMVRWVFSLVEEFLGSGGHKDDETPVPETRGIASCALHV